MATLQRTVSVASLSSLTSEGSITRKKKTKNTSVTNGFKYHWFETTLNFVKDDHRLSVNYSVTTAQAVFIRNVLNFEENPTLKLEKYAPLYEALKIFGLKFIFKLSKVSKDVLVLQKIPKRQKEFQMPDPTNILTRKMERDKKVIDRLSQNYMVEKSQTILAFIDDPTRVTLEFRNVKPLESMFLQIVLTAARPLFPEHGQMLQYLKEMRPKLDFNLTVVVGKVNKKTNERTVTFKKDPKFGKKAKKNREVSLNRSNISLNKNFVPSTKEASKAQKNTCKKENSVQNQHNLIQNKQNSMDVEQNSQNSMQSKTNSMEVEQNSMQKKTNSMEIDQNSIQNKTNSVQVEATATQEPMDVDSPRCLRSSVSNISVRSEPAGVRTRSASAVGFERGDSLERRPEGVIYGSQNNLNLPSSNVNNTERGRRREITGLNTRKAKLLEAMSMPVQLDKPARMMQKMGWNGGPLGIRGVGITEPIIPALDLVSGAGLGHVQESTPEVVYRKNFRLELLETLLNLMQTDKANVTLTYGNVLSKKEIKFVRHAVTSFNERQKISLKDLEEARITKLVIEVFRKLPTIVIHGTVSGCKKQIALRKLVKATPSPPSQRELPSSRNGFIKHEHLLKIADTFEQYRHKQLKQKKFFGTRVTLLIEILHLIKQDEPVKELFFESPLSKQESKYVVIAVQSLNRGRRPPVCTMEFEQSIVSDILMAIGDIRLDVKFETSKSGVRFEKIKVVPITTYRNSVLNSLNDDNNNAQVVNDDFVSNYSAQNKANNVLVSVQSNCFQNKEGIIDLTEKTPAKDTRNHDGNKKNDSSNRNSFEDINKVLKNRMDNLDKSKQDKNGSFLGNENHFANGKSIVENNFSSEDDDVILIEIEREIIVISDDESDDTNTENAQSINKSDKKDSLPGKPGLDIKSNAVEKNVDIGVTRSEGVADIVVSNSHISGESVITQKSNDLNVSNSQEIEFHVSKIPETSELDEAKRSRDITLSSSQDSTAFDVQNIQENFELDEANKSDNITESNSQNSSVLDILKIPQNTELNTSTTNSQNDAANDVSKILENSEVYSKKETANVTLSNTQDCTAFDTSKILENTELNTKTVADISIPKIPDTTVAETSTNDNNRGVNLKLEKDKTDIDLSVVKIEPKKEKLSYSEEFDNDLLDLEMVLNLDDDDVFDYTIIKNEESIDKIERPSSKRSRCDSDECSPDNFKKTKIFTFNKSKNMRIVPKDYPNKEITKECTIKIQTILSDAIEKCGELPLLKCHGIQDGGLVYSCHSEQSLFFVENCLCARDFKIISDVIIKKRSYRMRIRFNSLLDNSKMLFNRLELYNAGLITDSWCVKGTEKFDDYIVILVEIDEYSFKYVCDNGFSLYAGIDEARFSVVWD